MELGEKGKNEYNFIRCSSFKMSEPEGKEQMSVEYERLNNNLKMYKVFKQPVHSWKYCLNL